MRAPDDTTRGMDSFAGKLAVVTGGGSGIGRELVRQLAAQGCSVAACDLNADTVAQTAAMAGADAAPGVRVTSHACDVSDEAQVLRFRDELLAEHASDHVDLVFSNAGVFGGASFVKDSRQEWERTFAINWQGVYYCARTFLPLLIASGDGVLVNTSSVAGFWATAGAGAPITAYCTSEFAIKGFSEALIEDLRSNAPQVRVVVVMPGVVNTDIFLNSRHALGQPEWEQLSDAQLLELLPDNTRATLIAMGLLAEDFSADDLRQVIHRMKPEPGQGVHRGASGDHHPGRGAIRSLADPRRRRGQDARRAGPREPRGPLQLRELRGNVRPTDSTSTSGSVRNTGAVTTAGRTARDPWRVAGPPVSAPRWCPRTGRR
jgi:NAD(P)-dependent dehydrogenase (short-subunit alcohol dehydrogenase family)